MPGLKSLTSYAVASAVVVAIAYVLGASEWNALTWAIFAVVLSWMSMIEIARHTSLISSDEYHQSGWWFAWASLAVLLLSPLWANSWFPFFVGLAYGVLLLSVIRKRKPNAPPQQE